MNSIANTGETVRKHGDDFADRVANAGKDAVRPGEQLAENTWDKVGARTAEMSDKAAPALKTAAGQARSALDSGLDYVRDSWPDIQSWLEDATDKTIAYAKKEPLKASLIAAAAFALLLGIATRPSRR